MTTPITPTVPETPNDDLLVEPTNDVVPNNTNDDDLLQEEIPDDHSVNGDEPTDDEDKSKNTVLMDRDPELPRPAEQKGIYEIEVILPDRTAEEIEAALLSSPNMENTDTKWLNDVMSSSGLRVNRDGNVIRDNTGGLSFRDGQFNASLQRENGKWMLCVPTAKEPIRSGKPTISANNGASGAKLMGLYSHIGVGRPWQEVQYNSGFHVKFKPAPDTRFIDFQVERLQQEIAFGYSSYGVAFSADNIFFMRQLLNFITENIIETSVKMPNGFSPEELYKITRVTDIPALINGFMNTVFPNGFNYTRACTSSIGKCTHRKKGRISLARTIVCDTSQMTQWMIEHLSHLAPNSRSVEDVRHYQEQLTIAQGRSFKLYPGQANEVTFELTVPFISDYLEKNESWMNSIVAGVRSVAADHVPNNYKSTIMVQKANAAILCSHAPWIKAIRFAKQSPITNSEDIEKALSTLSSDAYVRNTIHEELFRFKDDCTISVAAIPKYKCPVCQKQQEAETAPRFMEYLPIDMVQTFFVLSTLKMTAVDNRARPM